MAFLDDMETVLTNASVITTGWTLYKGDLPDTPDQVIGLFETGGLGVPDEHGTALALLTFQLRVRASRGEYIAARTKFQAAWDALHGAKLTTPFYPYVMALSDGPIPFRDPEDRPNFTCSFKALKSR